MHIKHRILVCRAAILLFALALLLLGPAAFAQSAPTAQPTTQPRRYAFWPQEGEPRIQFLMGLDASSELAATRPVEHQPGWRLVKPYAVAVKDGTLYVADARGGTVVLDLKRREGTTLPAPRSKPCSVAIADDGTIYVSDTSQHNIHVFRADQKYQKTLALKDAQPVGLAVRGQELYVADYTGQCIRVLSRQDGTLLRIIGEPGSKDGQFAGPLSVTLDAQGNVYAVAPMTSRIQKFDIQGKFLMAFGQPGNQPGNLVRPKGIGIDKNGTIYVSDAALNNVQLFDHEGKFQVAFGGRGRHPGAMELPAGLCIDDADLELFKEYVHPAFEAECLILVTSQFGTPKLSIYAAGRLRPGKTLADIAADRVPVPTGMAP